MLIGNLKAKNEALHLPEIAGFVFENQKCLSTFLIQKIRIQFFFLWARGYRLTVSLKVSANDDRTKRPLVLNRDRMDQCISISEQCSLLKYEILSADVKTHGFLPLTTFRT